jgi:hypothetical protein
MNYWIFKANPEHYRIDDRLLDPAPSIVWAVTRYHERIHKDDTVFIWRAANPRGFCAILLIDAIPYTPAEDEIHDGYELPAASAAPTPAHWAKGHFIKRFPVIETAVIKKIPGLELFSFFSAFQQATNYSITRPEGARLLEFIENYKPEPAAPKRVAASKPRTPAASGPTASRGRKLAAPAQASTNVALVQCETCGRYVVSTDTERHIREVHAGHPVEWKKTK